MSEKRYERKCVQCHRPFVGRISYAKFCSGKCKAKWHRDNKDNVIKAQTRTLKSQAKVMAAVIPDPATVEKVSCEVGKDLTECKRPDGSHLYTDTDLWILIARINQLVFNEGTGSFISQLDTDMKATALIRDFEKRFECKFDEVKSSNPGIRPGKNDVENETLVVKYASLHYSR